MVQRPDPAIDDLELEEDKKPRPRWKGLVMAAIPGIVVGVLNYCDQDRSKGVIAQESAKVDVSVWPEIVEHRRQVAALTERIDKLEARIAQDELARGPVIVHTSSTPALAPLTAEKPAAPSKDAVEEKRRELF